MNPFDQKARTWDDDPAKVERARRVAELIAARVPMLSEARVLEVGAGTGLLGFSLRERAGHVTLADSSAEMLAVAKEKVRAAGPCNVDVVALDLERDPPPPQRYDVVCALLVLHHVHDTGALLKKLRGVLEPGGWLFIADLEKESPLVLSLSKHERGLEEDGTFHGEGFGGHHGFDRAELGRALAGAGFREVQFQRAFEVQKPVDGVPRSFPAFLASARA